MAFAAPGLLLRVGSRGASPTAVVASLISTWALVGLGCGSVLSSGGGFFLLLNFWVL